MVEDHPQGQEKSQSRERGEVFGPCPNLSDDTERFRRLNYCGDVFNLTLLCWQPLPTRNTPGLVR